MRFAMFAAILVLGACVGKPALDDEKLSQKDFNLEEFFDGRVLAKGQFQDAFGTVMRRFDVVVTAAWGGETLKLVEDFDYEDGTTEQRIWRLKKTGAVVADGVLGVAKGEERGDTFNWKCKIDLPVPDGTLRVNFDDWMWDLGDGRVLNHAYMKRYGADIGEVLITFEK
jgi:hypothetical protein